MKRGIACAGNWIVDIVHTIEAWPQKSDLVRIRDEVEGTGGGAANVLLALSAFRTGLPLYAMGLIGTDRHAETVLAAVKGAGADRAGLKQTGRAPTAHTHVMNLPGDSRTFFYHPGTNDLLSEEDVAVESAAARGARIFYLGYLNLLGQLDLVEQGQTGAGRVLARAKAAGMETAVDLVSTDRAEFRAAVEAALPHIDYLFLNEVEAARATGIAIAGAADESAIAAAAARLLAGGVARAVILHTPALGLWFGADGTRITRRPDPVMPEDIVSPVGAGDAFAAGCLYGIHEGWQPDACLRLGHRAAAAALKGATATESIPPLVALL
ncbi:carbohydrate kinase family protein [Paragemmobacter straminiformis]|uniref:Carbohydrate kinase family protein n=1 Tax=Paragemmobacter straminiformis TaxID=2045119 RepID=A0A842I2D4_9RHOB|nr:carbohydrate kinase family protein [Gemmobacter straminiformis]MBC2834422.1 carbohydrate kinase family protein [Gemmobacter straminiformis]